jgi:hypothetical protein
VRALSLILLSSLLLGGCDCASSPDEDALFSSLWPNGDGSSWTFRYVFHEASDEGGMIPQLQGLEAQEPAAIDPADLDARLALPLPPVQEVESQSDSGTLTLEFRGTAPTPDGPKQKLEGTFVEAGGKAPTADPILARIYLARPDLRTRMEELGMIPAGAGKQLDLLTVGPLFTYGGKFEKQIEWMGYYGDFSADSSYTIVRAPLATGAGFRHQLAPFLSDDVWEYGWILGWEDFPTDAGVFHALEVVYFLDLGESDIIDEDGDSLGTFSPFAVARAFYSPDVGPVYQREYDYLTPPIPELGIDVGVFFSETSLIDYELR